MNNKNLGILAVVAAIMVLWAVVQSRLSDRSTVELSGPSYLIQGLDPAQIGRIVIGSGDSAVTIERRDQQFHVTDKAGYPADPKRINDLITKCLDIKTLESYTSNPRNHEDLDVTEELTDEERARFRGELEYIDGFLHDLKELGSDSKLERLFEDLRYFFDHRDRVIIFTQYTDTMEYLREQLRQVYGYQVACYSGRGGEQWDGVAWMTRPKEELKAAFTRGDEVKILLFDLFSDSIVQYAVGGPVDDELFNARLQFQLVHHDGNAPDSLDAAA
mgnify:CR=1 FL=1